MYWVSCEAFKFWWKLSPPAELTAQQMKTWASIVYEHFKLPPSIEQKGGEIRYAFVCKKCGLSLCRIVFRVSCCYQEPICNSQQSSTRREY
jgi:hypothetical protein